jgi:uncharacterized repeat protein (TIGR03803 family)
MRLKLSAAFLVCIAALAGAQTFRVAHAFNGTDGANPYAGMIQGTDGYLYGTTTGGGMNFSGNVFKMTRGGKVTSIYDFCSLPNCADGEIPVTSLTRGNDGNFYGTTQSGGTKGGFGTIFKLTPAGVLTTLHSFSGQDGAAPYSPLLLASNGDFYGTTNEGAQYGAGSFFTITPAGVLTTLHNFCSLGSCSDGQSPVGPLIQGRDGSIYGTTYAGGDYAACNVDGCGIVYKIDLSGNMTTLHTFQVSDGDYPSTGVILGANGTLYGTTNSGGANSDGTVFSIDSGGTFTTIYNFGGSDGVGPSSMLLGSDGNFYGTTLYGGTEFPRGSAFELTPDGTLSNLHTFDGKHGKNPYGLVQDTNGVLYGTAYFGGASGNGIIFKVSTGLAPFVAMQPTSGNVGMAVTILGASLKGARAVSFNGTLAAFTVVSASEIIANVPAGASSGALTVTTSKGATLKSSGEFVVVP